MQKLQDELKEISCLKKGVQIMVFHKKYLNVLLYEYRVIIYSMFDSGLWSSQVSVYFISKLSFARKLNVVELLLPSLSSATI